MFVLNEKKKKKKKKKKKLKSCRSLDIIHTMTRCY